MDLGKGDKRIVLTIFRLKSIKLNNEKQKKKCILRNAKRVLTRDDIITYCTRVCMPVRASESL